MSLSSYDRDVRLTARTFQALDKLFAVHGGVYRCGWDAFRAEMTGFYGLDGVVLDSFARLGHFFIFPNRVVYRLGDGPKAVA